MGQSIFVWILVYGDGKTQTFTCTWDELCLKYLDSEPVAVIRGDFG